MTSLIAWTGADSRGPASFYLASDSRLSWRPHISWDGVQKVFASTRHPDILGFVGEALFTSLILGRVISLIDSDSLFTLDAAPEDRFGAISAVIQRAHSGYPGTARFPFIVVYCCRRSPGMPTSFALFELSWGPSDGWQEKAIPVPETSELVRRYGSGQPFVSLWLDRWKRSEASGTSRSIFSAFCDSLAGGADPSSGGAAQLVGIYRKGGARSFGVIYRGKRYLHGLCVDGAHWLGGVEWRNELFERCDWKTCARLENAQPQPRPRRI